MIDATHAKRRILFFALLFISVTQIGIDLYLPSLPAMQKDFSASASALKLSVTLYLVGLAVAPLIAGPLSDRWGRRPVILVALPLGFVGMVGCTASPNVGALLSFRLVSGIGFGACSALSRTLLRDGFEGKKLARASSYVSLAWALSPTLAPALGGYIEEWLGWRWNFALISLLTLLALLAVYFWMPETRIHRSERRTIIRDYLMLIKSPIFMGYTLVIAAYYGLFISVNIVTPFLLQLKLGLSPSQFGWSVFLLAAAYVIGLLLNSRAVHFVSLNALIGMAIIGFALSAGALLITSLLTPLSWVGLMIPVLAAYFSTAFLYPNCVTGFLHPFPHIAGTTGALFASLQYTSASLWGFVDAFVGHASALPLALALSTSAALTAVFFVAVVRPATLSRS